MRSMRSDPNNPNKTAIIIDHVGNYLLHGMPDADRDWTLEAKKKKSKDGEVAIRMCPNCFSVISRNAEECPWCHQLFERKITAPAEVVKTDLVEVYNCAWSNEELKQLRYNDYRLMRTWEELDQFRQTHTTKDGKKYSIMWAIRKAKELGISLPLKYRGLAWRMGLVI